MPNRAMTHYAGRSSLLELMELEQIPRLHFPTPAAPGGVIPVLIAVSAVFFFFFHSSAVNERLNSTPSETLYTGLGTGMYPGKHVLDFGSSAAPGY